MSPDADSGNASHNGSDVLANLPRHRPGRRTSRRAEAADGSAQAGSGPKRAASSAKASRATAASGASLRASGTASRGARSGAKSRSGSGAGATRKSSRPRAGSSRGGASTGHSTGIPLQGFELEEDVRRGSSVEPPSRFELASSVVELMGEGVEGLLRTSVSASGSLIKRTLELIPRP